MPRAQKAKIKKMNIKQIQKHGCQGGNLTKVKENQCAVMLVAREGSKGAPVINNTNAIVNKMVPHCR